MSSSVCFDLRTISNRCRAGYGSSPALLERHICDGYTRNVCVPSASWGQRSQVRVTWDPTTPLVTTTAKQYRLFAAWVIIQGGVQENIDTARAATAITVEAPAGHPKMNRARRPGHHHRPSRCDFFSELQRYIEIDRLLTGTKLSAGAQAIVSNPDSDSEELSRGVAEGGANSGGNLSDAVKKRLAYWPRRHGCRHLKTHCRYWDWSRWHQAMKNAHYIAQGDAAGQPLNGNQALVLRFAMRIPAAHQCYPGHCATAPTFIWWPMKLIAGH